jgi:uncharacterized protein YutE (UPF0331/DUF86 family)
MYDVERIANIISDIERYLRDLEELGIKNIEDLNDKKNMYALSMVLFSIINRTIDLADEIVMANSLGMPSTYREAFKMLEKNGYIDSTLMEKMSRLVSYRNVLAHEYYDITEKDLFELQKNIGIVRQFTDTVKDLVKNKAH